MGLTDTQKIWILEQSGAQLLSAVMSLVRAKKITSKESVVMFAFWLNQNNIPSPRPGKSWDRFKDEKFEKNLFNSAEKLEIETEKRELHTHCPKCMSEDYRPDRDYHDRIWVKCNECQTYWDRVSGKSFSQINKDESEGE